MRYNCQYVHATKQPIHHLLKNTFSTRLLKHVCCPIVRRRAVALTPTSQLHPTLDKDYSTAGKTGPAFVTVALRGKPAELVMTADLISTTLQFADLIKLPYRTHGCHEQI
jgi:hypothetical protein